MKKSTALLAGFVVLATAGSLYGQQPKPTKQAVWVTEVKNLLTLETVELITPLHKYRPTDKPTMASCRSMLYEVTQTIEQQIKTDPKYAKFALVSVRCDER